MVGLPIYGEFYDEYVPNEQELFGYTEKGSYHSSAELRSMFHKYHHLLKENQGKDVYYKVWVENFVYGSRSTKVADPKDPFRDGSSNPKPIAMPTDPSLIAFRGVSRKEFLVAFLSLWLCYFVFPRGKKVIRPETFVMADRMARGVRTSLAPPVLAYIYRIMKELTTSPNPGQYKGSIPFHYIFGWMAMYTRGLYTKNIPERITMKLPFLIKIAGTPVDRLNAYASRQFFISTLSGPYDTFARPIPGISNDENRVFTDGTDASGALLLRDPMAIEFLMSIHQGWLPYRSSDNFIIEQYLPNRVAHQFGLSQEVPLNYLDSSKIAPSLQGMVECWMFLLRRGTGSSFVVPATRYKPAFSEFYARWIDGNLKAYRSTPIDHILQKHLDP